MKDNVSKDKPPDSHPQTNRIMVDLGIFTHMKRIKLIVFGIPREILVVRKLDIQLEGGTVGYIRKQLVSDFPRLAGLNSLLIAVNNEYAEDSQPVRETDEIALIPPVSGG